jgi:hypothetical protein
MELILKELKRNKKYLKMGLREITEEEETLFLKPTDVYLLKQVAETQNRSFAEMVTCDTVAITLFLPLPLVLRMLLDCSSIFLFPLLS